MNEKKSSFQEKILKAAEKKYKVSREHLWAKYPNYAVLRHQDNQKWFAVFMEVSKDKLGLEGEDFIDILDIKVNPDMAGLLAGAEGFYPAYHMNKKSWITVLLDGSVSENEIMSLLDMSFEMTGSKRKGTSSRRRITDWLIPANPKFYDIQSELRENPKKPFEWKQSSNIEAGDRVYLYLAAPVRAVLYKCKVLEVNIPYQYEDENLTINRAMKLQLVEEYGEEQITAQRLREHGVYAVRGPRSMPESLIRELEKE